MLTAEDEELRAYIDRYRRLEKIVDERLRRILIKKNYLLMQITHRIKTVESIRGKMERKPDHYPTFYELRDILGFRVICYFSSDVDWAAKQIAKQFRVDWGKSKDKRELIDPRSFGYLSLHYICALPEDEGELCGLWFEIQLRSILQHSWAEIEHDLGYKTENEIPRAIRRSFSRAASLLETTDEIFNDIKRQLEAYTLKVKKDIRNESVEGLYIDAVTLSEFTAHNSEYRSLLREIAAITNANITEASPKNQLPLIEFLGIQTLSDLLQLIREEHDTAVRLAKKSLRDSELYELSSTVAYYYLFRAKLINGGYSKERIREFFTLTTRNKRMIERNTEKVLGERISIENEKLKIEN